MDKVRQWLHDSCSTIPSSGPHSLDQILSMMAPADYIWVCHAPFPAYLLEVGGLKSSSSRLFGLKRCFPPAHEAFEKHGHLDQLKADTRNSLRGARVMVIGSEGDDTRTSGRKREVTCSRTHLNWCCKAPYQSPEYITNCFNLLWYHAIKVFSHPRRHVCNFGLPGLASIYNCDF